MSNSADWQYYSAVAASGLSVLGWLVGLAGLGYFVYVLVTDGPETLAAGLTVGGVLAGALFAKLEHQLHDEPLER